MKFQNKRFCITFLGLICLCLTLYLSSCKKWIEVSPPINDIVGQSVYHSNSSAASVLTGIYTDMSNGGIFNGQSSISFIGGLSADELIAATEPSNILDIIYTNNLTNDGIRTGLWNGLYGYIFRVNAAIEGISNSTGITQDVKRQLIGEAKFLRAFYYFYLVNFYGDAPWLSTTDIKVNSVASRNTVSEIYDKMVTDLLSARDDLNDNYISSDIKTPTAERLRPNKAIATALLSRVYLFMEKWSLAEEESTKVISDPRFKLVDRSEVFLKNSDEAIWQLQPVSVDHNTLDAESFVLAVGGNYSNPGPNGGGRPVVLSKHLFNSFEPGDERKSDWIDSVQVDVLKIPYPFKYKAWIVGSARTEYLMVLRLAEQILIRAEARARQGRLTGMNSAEEDLNIIRHRAGLSSYSPINQQSMYSAILNERRHELFTEWGHRWFDLKRTGEINNVMIQVSSTKNSVWLPYKALFPIPVEDIRLNPNFRGKQNPGYPEL